MAAGPAAETPPNVEVDLDDGGAPTPDPRPSAPRGRTRAAWAAGGLAVGLLLGHAWLPGGVPEPAPAPAPARTEEASPPVRVSFGAYGPGVLGQVHRVGRRLEVPVPAVVVNETTAPLLVRELRISGPGAGLAPQDFGMDLGFPLHLPPGEATELPFTLTSDCAVAVRPVPRITLVVAPDDGSAGRPVDVRIPDLGSLWGRTLDPSLCLD
jgi:hypothetical protein